MHTFMFIFKMLSKPEDLFSSCHLENIDYLVLLLIAFQGKNDGQYKSNIPALLTEFKNKKLKMSDKKAPDKDESAKCDNDNKAPDEDVLQKLDDGNKAPNEDVFSKRENDNEAHIEGGFSKRVKLSPKEPSEELIPLELKESWEMVMDDGETLQVMFQSGDTRNKTALTIKKTEMLKSIMEQYSKMHNKSVHDLIFTFDGQKLTGDETPEDIDMEDENCIDVSPFVPVAHCSKNKIGSPKPSCSYSGLRRLRIGYEYEKTDHPELSYLRNFMNYSIEIFVQSNVTEEKWRTVTTMMTPMHHLMHEYAAIHGLNLDELAFEFDGQIMTGSETPDSLDMETGNVIDVTVCGPVAHCSRTAGTNLTSQASTSRASTSQASTSRASTSRASTSQASTSQASTSRASTSQASTSQASTSRASTSQASTSRASTSQASTSRASTSQASEVDCVEDSESDNDIICLD